MEFAGAVESTQARARGWRPWTAIVATAQTRGRGQAERTFVSDPGGLYLTAVLPYGGDPRETLGFALAVGWAVRRELRRAGARGVRLRWPNDLMVGERKVGGILIEQGGADTLLVGVGLNVTNCPWRAAPDLRGIAGRLADAWRAGRTPGFARLAERVLRGVRAAHGMFARRRLAGFAGLVNGTWGRGREIVLEPARGGPEPERRGRFAGIDADGAVCLELPDTTRLAVPAHRIARLREVPPRRGAAG